MSAFEALVAEAMLAPSAHNTQPARWSQRGESILVCADLRRRLPVADPEDRDLQIACGAAVEGTVLALAARGKGAEVTWLDAPDAGHIRPIAALCPGGPPDADDVRLAGVVRARSTHRTGFLKTKVDLSDWRSEHMTLVTDPGDIARIGRQIDIASAAIMQDRHFRQELLGWMRLRADDPRAAVDGLSPGVLGMDRVTSLLTRPVLGTWLYDLLSRLGLGPALSGEARISRDATAIALFHWPADGSRLQAGRVFYRLWLEASARGLAGWPAAALADHPPTAADLATRFGIPASRRLLNALRLGRPANETPSRARLSVQEVILAPQEA